MKLRNYYIKKLSATNMLKIIAGRAITSTDKRLMARPYAVTHIQFDSTRVLDSAYGNYLDEAQLRDIVTIYWTQSYDGQLPTTTTVDAIVAAFKDYCQTATRVTARFLTLKRVQDQFNLDNDDIGQVGEAFVNPYDCNIGGLGPIYGGNSRYYVIQEGNTDGRLVQTRSVFGDFMNPANGISSARWTKEFTAPLKDVFLPLDVINMCNLLFSTTLELSSDDDETLRYVNFWHPGIKDGDFPDANADGSVSNFLSYYNADIASLRALLSAYPVLRAILNDMGFKPVVNYVNTRRDLSGKTLHVIRDNSDELEYVIKSVLLSQVDNQNLTDMLNNSRVVECKSRYLPEAVKSSDFNAIIGDLYNVQNFIRGKITVLCVSIVLATCYHSGGSAHYDYYVTCHSGDNLSLYTSSDASAACAMATTIDTVAETDALQSCILHNIDQSNPSSLNVAESLIEGSARTFLIPASEVGNLLFCVNSAFYINTPAVIEKLHNDTLYSAEAGVANSITFGEDLFTKKSRYSKDRKKDKGKGKDKSKEEKAADGSAEDAEKDKTKENSAA